ncbi:MAG TPA: hypothetical protein ENH25_05785 [candidate division Zixibacteria bacterium]|nr:hypothetical protein [candidate division Zixibacteria bacterium]
MKSLRLLFTLIALATFSITAYAQDEDEEKWRNFEVGIHTGLNIPSGDFADWNDSLGAKTGFNVSLSGGYYFTTDFCTGVYFSYTQNGMEGDWGQRYRLYDMGVYAKYAFSNESNFEPYVKVTGGIVYPKFPTWVTPERNKLREQSYDPGISLGGYLGILWYTAEFGGLFLEAGYHNDLVKDVEANYQGEVHKMPGDLNYIEIRTGITAYFGSE